MAQPFALRAAVLANLWETYAITPITQADVASLLSVLSGAVEEPSEVTLAVGVSVADVIALTIYG